MAKIKYREVKLSTANRSRLEEINSIIAEYQADGYVLTLRQLYYQLVSRDVIANKQAEYAKLSTLLKEGRMGGIVDWDAIEDRLRRPSVPSSWDSPKDIIKSAIHSYARPRLQGQSNYMEVWVEKDALSGVLKRVTEKYHVPIVVNRGYSSVTAMRDAFVRFENALWKTVPYRDKSGVTKYRSEKKIVIFYLGDFDPSGIDMIRDVTDRVTEFFAGSAFMQRLWNRSDVEEFELFLTQWVEDNFTVIPIALTMEQIKQYDPPPNPAKITDPRAEKYIALYGATSWEVDALPPPVLNALLDDAITSKIDMEKYGNVVGEEEADKQKLQDLLDQF